MKSLGKRIGEGALAGLCGLVLGLAVGHSVEESRKAMRDCPQKYVKSPYVIGGFGAGCAALAVAIYAVKGNKRNVYGGDDSEEGKDEE